jgi:hypothetical protein
VKLLTVVEVNDLVTLKSRGCQNLRHDRMMIFVFLDSSLLDSSPSAGSLNSFSYYAHKVPVVEALPIVLLVFLYNKIHRKMDNVIK